MMLYFETASRRGNLPKVAVMAREDDLAAAEMKRTTCDLGPSSFEHCKTVVKETGPYMVVWERMPLVPPKLLMQWKAANVTLVPDPIAASQSHWERAAAL